VHFIILEVKEYFVQDTITIKILLITCAVRTHVNMIFKKKQIHIRLIITQTTRIVEEN
jgi:hypothetical protein